MSKFCVVLMSLLLASAASAATFCLDSPPVIDGVFDCREWDNAQVVDLEVNIPEGGTAPARLYFMNDNKFLYVGLRILRAQNWYTGLSVSIDANYDRISSSGDDMMGVCHNPRYRDEPLDEVFFTGGICPIGALCTGNDTNFGGRNDVAAAVGTDGKYTTYEFSKPLATLDGLDATMPVGSTVGMMFGLQLIGADGKSGDTYYPALPSIGKWVDYVIRDCTYWR